MPEPTACETARKRVSDLIAGALEDGEAAALNAHLEKCEECYRLAVTLFRQDRALTEMSAREQLKEASSRLRQGLGARRPTKWLAIGSVAAAALLTTVYFVWRAGGSAAILEQAAGEVHLVDGGDSRPLQAGEAIRSGQGVETRGKGSGATIAFADGTKLKLAEKTSIRDLRDGPKRLRVVRGDLTAEVARQAEGRPLVLSTPDSEAEVLGTTLRLVVDGEMGLTRLEVTEGRVRLTRLADRKAVEVPAGHFAVAASGVELALRPLSPRGAPKDLHQLDYPTLRSILQLRNKSWAAIPWRPTLTDAREAAAREKKPIFMFVANHNPLGFVGGNGIIFREAVLNDPEVVTLVSTRFIPVAIGNTASPNLTAAERAWLEQFQSGIGADTFGISAFTPEGRKLMAGVSFDSRVVKTMLESVLRAFKPAPDPLPPLDRQGVESIARPPEGGLTLNVTWKAFYDEPESNATTMGGKYDKVFQHALGSDRIWARKDEAEALGQGKIPDSLKTRMVRFCLSQIFMSKVRGMNLGVEGGRLQGSVELDPPTLDPVSLQGILEAKEGKVVRLELLARGSSVWSGDEGFMVNLAVAPRGKRVPTAIFFELADPSEALSRTAPRHARDPNYLR